MAEITEEMRDKLRKPLPPEAVSQHPTKSYLSSIKSIYVAERINDVFGVGSWTLKGELVERLEKFVVVKAVLEIPKYGFYGEAYGGNDNTDIGDAYKGATTDGFTKIAGQQLEIGLDVFKGIKSRPAVKQEKATEKPQPEPPESKIRGFAVETRGNLPTTSKEKADTIPIGDLAEPNEWYTESLKKIKWGETTIKSFLGNKYQVDKSGSIFDVIGRLSQEQEAEFVQEIQDRLSW